MMKLRSVSLPLAVPALFPFMESMNNTKRILFLVCAAVILLAAIQCIVCLFVSKKLTKKKATKACDCCAAKKEPAELTDAQKAAAEADARRAAATAPVEETPVEEAPVEEAPAEEAPAEEAPAEEAPVEEAPAEEAPAEEAPAEEAPAEEAPAEEAPAEEAPVEEAPAEEAPAEEAPAEEPKDYTPLEANIPIVSAEGKTVAYSTYRRSFLARIIASPEDVQSRYDELKNALLSYKKVSARISWSYESIKSGRTQLAKFAICGKTLCLFLAIDPNTLEDSKYNVSFVGDSKKYETVPCRLRLTSKRSVKWGLELIELMAQKEGLEPNPKYTATSYVPANEPDEILLEKGLIKKVQ